MALSSPKQTNFLVFFPSSRKDNSVSFSNFLHHKKALSLLYKIILSTFDYSSMFHDLERVTSSKSQCQNIIKLLLINTWVSLQLWFPFVTALWAFHETRLNAWSWRELCGESLWKTTSYISWLLPNIPTPSSGGVLVFPIFVESHFERQLATFPGFCPIYQPPHLGVC